MLAVGIVRAIVTGELAGELLHKVPGIDLKVQ